MPLEFLCQEAVSYNISKEKYFSFIMQILTQDQVSDDNGFNTHHARISGERTNQKQIFCSPL